MLIFCVPLAAEELRTQDGLGIRLDPGGRVRSLRIDHKELPSAGNEGGIFVRDYTDRSGATTVIALGEIDVDAEGDESFDREWVAHLLEVALARLGREHPSYHETLGRFLFEKQSYDAIAGALEKTVSQVRNHIHRGRTKLVQYLREEVRQYSISEEDYQEELRALSLHFPEEKKAG